MSQRYEFVQMARQQCGLSFRALCARYGISPKTGYKWLHRFEAGGMDALADQSRRPHASPEQCPREVAERVVELRRLEPTWGGRKLRRRLQDLGEKEVPAASTCTEILRRSGLLQIAQRQTAAYQRFVRAQPNELWQMDFKGDFATQAGPRCNPFTALDDRSRFNLALVACANQTTAVVQQSLIPAFDCYGLPDAILCDNGGPWGRSDPVCPYTVLTVWLLRLGIRVLHGRPYHPQTQGKEERFHRTLENDLLARHTWSDLAHCAREFSRFRERYNFTRPHDSLQGDTPAAHYRPSPRQRPAQLLPLKYPGTDKVRRVHGNGTFDFSGRKWRIGRAFAELPVGLRPSAQADGQWEVFFACHCLGRIDLTTPSNDHSIPTIYQ